MPVRLYFPKRSLFESTSKEAQWRGFLSALFGKIWTRGQTRIPFEEKAPKHRKAEAENIEK